MKTFFVVNPKSANGQTGKRWAEMSAKLGAALGELGHSFTERPMHAAELARKAIDDGYQCIVAVGGDGTVNEVVNGFFRDGRTINGQAALGVLPRGTGGDFRKTFGWELDLDSALARLKTERTEPFDVGRVDFIATDGTPATRYFANIASFGVSGLVDKRVNESSKALGGKLSFMLGSMKALMQYKDKKVSIVVDGGAPEEVHVTTLAVGNGRYFGGGMKVCPDAQTADGVFDVTLWSGYGLTDFAFKSKGVYEGTHVKWKGTRCLRCTRLEAKGDEEVLLDIDGEQPGRLPCTIRILPSAIRLKI